MIDRIRVEGFRAFPSFEMSGLGRINLLVGMNNSGKTSLLEAIHLVASGADPQALAMISGRRGERFWDEAGSRAGRAEINFAHWFHGHEIEAGSSFVIEANGGQFGGLLSVCLTQGQPNLFSPPTTPAPVSGNLSSYYGVSPGSGLGSDELFPETNLTLRIEFEPGAPRIPGHFQLDFPLSGRGGLPIDQLRAGYPPRRAESGGTVFVPTAGLTSETVAAMFDDIVLTREEDLVLEAVRTIEPKVERIATTGDRSRSFGNARVGVHVRLAGLDQRLPIGIMGDGMWRMLALAIALAKAANGVLLLDEIDTGLHFTVMDRMWEFVSRAAEKLNVQVFATTHSRDCVESLSVICRKQSSPENRVSIQRIEADQAKSVPFSEREIIAAAERGVEIR